MKKIHAVFVRKAVLNADLKEHQNFKKRVNLWRRNVINALLMNVIVIEKMEKIHVMLVRNITVFADLKTKKHQKEVNLQQRNAIDVIT